MGVAIHLERSKVPLGETPPNELACFGKQRPMDRRHGSILSRKNYAAISLGPQSRETRAIVAACTGSCRSTGGCRRADSIRLVSRAAEQHGRYNCSQRLLIWCLVQGKRRNSVNVSVTKQDHPCEPRASCEASSRCRTWKDFEGGAREGLWQVPRYLCTLLLGFY